MLIDGPVPPAQAIAGALATHLPLPVGSLCVWGDWFGKPRDNDHILVAIRHDQDELVLEFDHHEVLRVGNPRRGTVDVTASRGQRRLVIAHADWVEWGWFCYGRPETPENWSVQRYWVEGSRVRATSTGNCVAQRFAPSRDEPAVAFL